MTTVNFWHQFEYPPHPPKKIKIIYTLAKVFTVCKDILYSENQNYYFPGEKIIFQVKIYHFSGQHYHFLGLNVSDVWGQTWCEWCQENLPQNIFKCSKNNYI